MARTPPLPPRERRRQGVQHITYAASGSLPTHPSSARSSHRGSTAT
eukprot:CAMPEP_0183343696 /NCGR_PEP_ID=MMETSP0164_2-20130417/9545_1 /TAXON_ID=221442 /ORGANISM="Coccolithus pelagicus ssp braarudi, Strain PLY182g" /LENGTH=45 /DNA_ID= /DNA_START= /DNA_END= /DNA_ORIENTATION=